MGNCQTFYVRRPNRSPQTWNAFANMVHCWVSKDLHSGVTNKLNEDFDVYWTKGEPPADLGAHADFDAFLKSIKKASFCNYDDCNWYPNGNSWYTRAAIGYDGSMGWPDNFGTAGNTRSNGIGPGVGGFRDCNTCHPWVTIELETYSFQHCH